MKTLILTIALAFTAVMAEAQTTYSNSTTPTQPAQPGIGTNTLGQPKQAPPSYTVAPNPVDPVAPSMTPNLGPNNTSPVKPNTQSPITPITPITPNKE